MREKRIAISSPDGRLRAVVSTKGAELISLRRQCLGRSVESIYRSKTGWRGGAPWLFPAVGRNWVGPRLAWRHRGRLYPMPIHGFAKDADWSLESRTRHSATLVFRSDARSRRYFPFDFATIVGYECAGRAILARFSVFASWANAASMPFSVGSHLTLRTPAGHRCLVRTPARRELLLNSRGLLSGDWRPADLRRPNTIWGASETLDRVFGHYSEAGIWADLINQEGAVRVEQNVVSSPEHARQEPSEDSRFVFFGDRKAGFLCLEPWLGRPDSLNDGGTVRLEPGAGFAWEISIRFMLSSGACRAS